MTLSPREREILELVGRDGMSDKLIALRLGIGCGTVRTYIQRILARYPSAKRPRAALVDLYHGVSENADSEVADATNSD